MKTEQLAQLKDLFDVIDDGMTQDQFAQAFNAVLQVVKGIKTNNEQQLKAMHQEIAALASKVAGDNAGEMENIKKLVMGYCTQVLKKLLTEHDQLTMAVDAKIDASHEGIAAAVLKRMPPYPEPPAPQLGEDMRNALESLSGDDRLDISAVKGVEEAVAKLTKPLSAKIDALPRGGARSSHSTRLTDLSTQTNGSLKVFSVPEGLAGLLFSSDFPNVLMENNGFTLNKTRTQLTMTTANAPSASSQLVYQSVDIANTY